MADIIKACVNLLNGRSFFRTLWEDRMKIVMFSLSFSSPMPSFFHYFRFAYMPYFFSSAAIVMVLLRLYDGDSDVMAEKVLYLKIFGQSQGRSLGPTGWSFWKSLSFIKIKWKQMKAFYILLRPVTALWQTMISNEL